MLYPDIIQFGRITLDVHPQKIDNLAIGVSLATAHTHMLEIYLNRRELGRYGEIFHKHQIFVGAEISISSNFFSASLDFALSARFPVIPGYYSVRPYNIGCAPIKIDSLALGVSLATAHTHILAQATR